MPFVAFGLAVLVLVWLSKSAKPDVAPKQELPSKPASQSQQPKSMAPMNAGQLLLLASDKLTNAIFSGETAQTVAKFGLAIAITVGTMNVFAGIVVAIVVLMVAGVINVIEGINDMNSDHHLEGITEYWKQWDKVRSCFEQSMRDKAALANQKLDEIELMNAANAYADGFMEWRNYLTAWRAFQGGIWGRTNQGPLSPTYGGQAVLRAWKKGMYAGQIEPAFSTDAGEKFFKRTGHYPGPVIGYPSWVTSNDVFGDYLFNATDTLMNVFPPDGVTLTLRNEQLAKNRGLPFDANLAAFCRRWYNVGKYHANTAQLLLALQQPIQSSKLNHVAESRNHGWFVGATKAPPDIPVNVGVSVDGYTYYTPDDKTIKYVGVP